MLMILMVIIQRLVPGGIWELQLTLGMERTVDITEEGGNIALVQPMLQDRLRQW